MTVEPCHYCGRHTFERGRFPKDARSDQLRTRDHTVPKCKGGRHTVTCCERCNMAKADSSYEDFKEFADMHLRGASYYGAKQTRWGFNIFRHAKLL